jgi:hypothetical protein
MESSQRPSLRYDLKVFLPMHLLLFCSSCFIFVFIRSFYMISFEGAALTNNTAEGFNSSWTQSLPTHASLYTVFETFLEVRSTIALIMPNMISC